MSRSYDISVFGQRLKELRKKRKITMQDLADRGIADRRTIGDWEHGKCVPELARVLDLCEVLDCDFDYLFGKIDLPHKEETDICRETGLSEEAVEKLIGYHSAMLSNTRDNDFLIAKILHAVLTENDPPSADEFFRQEFSDYELTFMALETLIAHDDLLQKIAMYLFNIELGDMMHHSTITLAKYGDNNKLKRATNTQEASEISEATNMFIIQKALISLHERQDELKRFRLDDYSMQSKYAMEKALSTLHNSGGDIIEKIVAEPYDLSR